MIGKHKTSNSVKGFGNGFISKADRGLIAASNGNKAPSSSMTHLRSMSVPRQSGAAVNNTLTFPRKSTHANFGNNAATSSLAST